MKKIFVVSNEHKICDKRVIKTVEILSKDYEVYYQYLKISENDESKCTKNYKNVIYMPQSYPGKSSNVIHWYKKWLSFYEKIWMDIEKVSPDIVYFHNTPFTIEDLIRRSKKMGAKVVLDNHEIFPEQDSRARKKILGKIVKGTLWKRYAKALSLSDKLIFVSKEAAEYVFQKTGVEKPFFILPNIALYCKSNPLYYKERKKKIVIVGGTKRKVPPEYIDAILNAGYEVEIIGNMDINYSKHKIKTIGFLPYDEMMEKLSTARFSLNIFYPPSGSFSTFYSNHVYSLPNKFYDSLASGTPVLVYNYFESMARITKEDGVGYVFDSPNNLKKFLETLNETKYNRIIQNIIKNSKKYCWNDYWKRNFVEFVTDLNKTELL